MAQARALAAGAAAWAVGTLIVGDKVTDGIVLTDTVTGLGYVAGVFCLVLVVLSTRATGQRKGRAIPITLLVLLPGAGSSCSAACRHGARTDPPASI